MSSVGPTRATRLGWPLLLASLGLTFVVMLLGPSATEAPLPGSAPLLRLDTRSPAWVVTSLLAIAVIVGAIAVWLGMTGRWRPSAGALLAVGLAAVAAFAVAPPVGSADQVSYAAYGRMAATGHDPWSTTPEQRAAAGDPVAAAVEAPWRTTPSVYGPLAAGEQDLAARMGGTDVAAIVEILDALGALAVAAAALALWRATGIASEAEGPPRDVDALHPPAGAGRQRSTAASAEPDNEHESEQLVTESEQTFTQRQRAMLLFAANPLLLIPAVAGGHVDALLASATVAAVIAGRSALSRRSPNGGSARPAALVFAGIFAGLAADIKITGTLVLIGLIVSVIASRWTSWSGVADGPGVPGRTGTRLLGAATVGELVAVVAGAAAVTVPAYLAAGRAAIDQLRRASHLISAATPWRPVVDVLQHLTARGAARDIVGALAIVLFAGLAIATARLTNPRGWRLGEARPGRGVAALTAAIVAAYLLASPYALPWYDAAAWAAVALATISTIDRALMIHTAVLTLAYIPGRAAVRLSQPLRAITDTMRAGVGPIVLTALVIWIVVPAIGYHRRVRAAQLGPVEERRVLPASTDENQIRQERGTHPLA